MKLLKEIGILSSICSLVFMSSLSFADINSDNSKVNQRDRLTDEATADQQSTNQPDTEITRKVRRDLIANKDLSTYAHNVKIITVDGQITLKGPVRSKEEEDIILKYARSISGVTKVTNELEVATSK